jgi:DHA2 family multidrug resistance protein
LSAVAFATLSTSLRSMGTSIFNLLRNIGSSIGISIVTALLARNAQLLHSRLVEHITRYGVQAAPPVPYSFTNLHGMAALDAAVARQAQMIAYNNDFKLMLILTLAAIPLPLLLKPRPAASREPAAALE